MYFFRALLLFTVLSSGLCYGQKNKLSHSPAPAWIESVPVIFSKSTLDEQAYEGYIDLAMHKQVNLAEQAVFYRSVIRVISEAGIDANSEISIEFDPLYESIILHDVTVIRKGKTMNRLKIGEFKLLQQEKELAKNMYNGNYTAYMILDDIRVGDIIDYSYTRRGFNPVFGNKWAEIFQTQYSVPIYNLFYRILAPANRKLQFKDDSKTAPDVQSSGDITIYKWVLNDVPPLRLKGNTPGWYDPYGAVYASEFQDWQQVSEWAAGLFATGRPLSPALMAKVKELAQSQTTTEDKITSILHFVQDEIRYMSVSMGKSSHLPAHPNKVFERRWGDCKDKAYLFCAMMQSMQIEAVPVLVNTWYKKAIASWLASPRSFNHVVVRVKHNGKEYWLDPTISFQRGPLQDHSFPDYQVGLVARQGEKLTTIPNQEKGKMNVKEVFIVPDFSAPASLTVTTNHSGKYADDVRYQFKMSGKEIPERYENFYKRYYPGVKADSIRFLDQQDGSFVVNEYYTVTGLFAKADGAYKASFEPYLVNTALTTWDDSLAGAPLSINFPASIREQIEIYLPDAVNVGETNVSVHDKTFSFSSGYSNDGKLISLRYNYDAFSDFVDAANGNEYKKNYQQMLENAAFMITMPADGTPSVAPGDVSSALYRCLYAMLAAAVLITFLVRRARRVHAH